MSSEPTLVFDAGFEGLGYRRYAGEISFCCGAPTDTEDRCSNCELISSAPAPYRCSECNAQVANLTPNADMLLECAVCGARWADLDGADGTVLHNAAPANAWNPAKAPARYTQYLTSFAGYTPEATAASVHSPLTNEENATVDDEWDGVS